jgi:hypothetical protein
VYVREIEIDIERYRDRERVNLSTGLLISAAEVKSIKKIYIYKNVHLKNF